MKISRVDVLTTPMSGSWLTDKVIANPMSIYPEYAERRSSWYRTQSAGVVAVGLEDGTEGYGFIGGSKATAAASILREQLRDLVLGRSVFQTELISELLFRASIPYGLGGVAQDLISGIDIALWDAKGKLLQRPVHDLLGGRTGNSLHPYLTSWDAAALERYGVRDVKIAMPYGPAAGEQGKRENEKAVAATRAAIGGDGWIALDCYMSWDVAYAVDMCRRLQGLGVAWIEEPVMPDDYDGYRRIRESVDCMVTGGEHTYTLSGFRQLIVDGAVDIVQPDIYRAGGPTVLKKVAALAKAYNRKLICHGVGLATYHFLASNGADISPRCEFMDIYDGGSAQWVLDGEPAPRDGRLVLGDEPGFGYTLNRQVLDEQVAVAPIW
jgi:L-rhamnonate dehydratase